MGKFIGGNIEMIHQLSGQLKARGGDLTTLSTTIGHLVSESKGYWVGGTNDNLNAAWADAAPAMARLVEALDNWGTFATTTATNIDAAAN